MLRTILAYGAVAGIAAGTPLSILVIAFGEQAGGLPGMAVGYLLMLAALGIVFVAIKRRRDGAGGGVIRFWPALGLGLGISAVAGVLYVVCWEIAQALSGMDFASAYARMLVDQARADGATGERLARAVAGAEQFRRDYARLSYRLPVSFMEIFPVGVLVSLVSAGLLSNPRFLPAAQPPRATSSAT